MNKRIVSALLVLLVGITLLPDDASGIPAFARRYKFSCTTCHAPFPRLKAFGDEFAGAGFVIAEEEKERDYVTGGDELLWLNRTFQLGVRLDAWMSFEDDTTLPESVDTDMQMPWGLKILSGGALTKNIGYYFYFYLSERGEVAGIEDAYVHFDDVGGLPLDLMVGQFQTSDPLMKRELRLSYEDYEIYKTRVGVSQTNLAYDRGIMAVYGFESTGTDLVAFVVNGNGKPEAGANRKFDNDRRKNFGVRVNQAIGEFGSIGGYYYIGKEGVPIGGMPGSSTGNEIVYYGPDASFSYGPLTLTGQYLIRTDSNPMGLATEPSVEPETTGIIAELVYLPGGDDGRHSFVAIYNDVGSDIVSEDYRSVSFGAGYLIARNLRAHAEYTRDLHNDRNRVVAGFVSGF